MILGRLRGTMVSAQTLGRSFSTEVVEDSVGAALFLCSVGNGSPNAACPDDLTLNCWQSLLALVIAYSPLVTYIFCIKGQKRLFLGFHRLANLFSSGIASPSGEQLLLILEGARTQKEACCYSGSAWRSLCPHCGPCRAVWELLILGFGRSFDSPVEVF